MEQKKYRLTAETMCFDSVTLHRIQALKDFGNVEAGELGGWVESEKNLSQSGDCWIAMEAKAYGGAEELYILNCMAPRAFGLTDQQVYDIIALAIWNRKNQQMIMIGQILVIKQDS